MTAIILEYIKEENPHRKDELEQEIMEYREKNPDALHDQEYNELAAHIDYIIKVKCSVTQTVPLLMSGEAIPLKLYDDNFGKRMLGIYTMVGLLIIICSVILYTTTVRILPNLYSVRSITTRLHHLTWTSPSIVMN